MTYKRKQLPKYCLHKSTGRAFVRIDGKTYYLGKHGSTASRLEYDRIIAEFIANGRQSFQSPDEILVENLIVRFLDYIERERNYCESIKERFRFVLRRVNDLYGKQLVSQFSPSVLKTIRRQYLENGLSRRTINAYINDIRQMFYWGFDEEIVPAEIAGALRMVKNLQTGRSSAVEYDPIEPVPDEIVEKTLPHIESQQVRDMVLVQRFIGGRPQDVRNMRFCDIDTSGEVWKYTPFTHKTKKKGKIRILPIGPRAQAILQKYFDQCTDREQFVFPSPDVKKPQQWYADTIKNACKRAGVPHWTPNQLRHAAGTEVREKFGLEYAQAVLGHANAKTTEIYARVSFEKAAKVAREIG